MINLENNQISFVLITLAYWFFMLTDGALRMIVLLHFHILGFTPLQLAYLFLLYEFLGMITNLTAGWIAKRFGLNKTLFAGIILQTLSLLILSQVNQSWNIPYLVTFVMFFWFIYIMVYTIRNIDNVIIIDWCGNYYFFHTFVKIFL